MESIDYKYSYSINLKTDFLSKYLNYYYNPNKFKLFKNDIYV